MSILPQILYIFRSLPLPIPPNSLRMSKTIWKFTWGGKKARCSRNNLIPHKSVGGVGFADIQDYLWAIRLDQLKHWFHDNNCPLWVEIERSSLPISNPITFLISDIWEPWETGGLSPSIQISLQTWRFLQKLGDSDTHDLVYDLPIDLLGAKISMLSTTKHKTHTRPFYRNNTQICRTNDDRTPTTQQFAVLLRTHFPLPKGTSHTQIQNIIYSMALLHKNTSVC